MIRTDCPTAAEVEQWNDVFAREHDIEKYYDSSSFLIRWIERCRLNLIQNLTAAERNDRILEVGCGGGHVLRLFPDAELTGVDVSGEMIRKSHRNLLGYRARLLKGELRELDLPDESFDRIICTEVLEHVVDPVEILQQIRRLVRPDGRAVITFPNDRLINGVKRCIHKCKLTILPPFRSISWGGDRYHLHIWRIREMHELLSRHFHVETVRFAPMRFLPIRCCFLCTHL